MTTIMVEQDTRPPELQAGSNRSAGPNMSRRQIRKRLQSVFGLALVLIIALIASPHSPRGGLIFLEAGNITDVLRQVSEIGIISLGMTFVILTGGIDLSVGTVLALASSIVALVLTRVAFGVASG